MPATEQQEQADQALPVEATMEATAAVVSHVESRGDTTEPFKMERDVATRRDADQRRSIMTSR